MTFVLLCWFAYIYIYCIGDDSGNERKDMRQKKTEPNSTYRVHQ